jgi:outer membrane protein
MNRMRGMLLCFCTVVVSLFLVCLQQVCAENVLQLYKMALDSDPQLKGASYERLALKESVKQVWGRLTPDVRFEAVGGQVFQNIVSSNNSVYTTGTSSYDTKTYTFRVTQPLFQYSLFMELSQAKILSKRADIDFAIAKQDLILRLAQAYVAALYARENVAYVKAEKTDIETFSERANTRYQAGMAPITDVYDARARLASVNAQLVKTETEYRDALQALRQICGQSVADLPNLKEDVPILMPEPSDPGPWVQVGVEKNLKLLSQQQDAQIAKKEVSRQKAGHYPTLDFLGRAYRQDTGGSVFGGGSVIDTQEALLQVTVPLFQGGYVLSKTREAMDRQRKAGETVERQKREVIRQVNASYDGVVSSISRVDALKKSIESQAILVQAKDQGYRSGVYASLAVLDAARDLYLYRRDYAQSRYEYILNTLRLKQAVGSLDEPDLDAVNSWLE